MFNRNQLVKASAFVAATLALDYYLTPAEDSHAIYHGHQGHHGHHQQNPINQMIASVLITLAKNAAGALLVAGRFSASAFSDNNPLAVGGAELGLNLFFTGARGGLGVPFVRGITSLGIAAGINWVEDNLNANQENVPAFRR